MNGNFPGGCAFWSLRLDFPRHLAFERLPSCVSMTGVVAVVKPVHIGRSQPIDVYFGEWTLGRWRISTTLQNSRDIGPKRVEYHGLFSFKWSAWKASATSFEDFGCALWMNEKSLVVKLCVSDCLHVSVSIASRGWQLPWSSYGRLQSYWLYQWTIPFFFFFFFFWNINLND